MCLIPEDSHHGLFFIFKDLVLIAMLSAAVGRINPDQGRDEAVRRGRINRSCYAATKANSFVRESLG
ncbi:MAG: hypothetical protein ACYC9N_00285, partial [Thermoanaerobaculia bacterium]